MSVKIIADSTCDLSKNLLEKYDISVLPLHIVLGDKEYKDGLEISPDEIYEWSNANKEAPKTSAAAISDTIDIYSKYLKSYDEIICFSISGQMSTTVNVMRMAAEELDAEDKIHIIDSENLSTGGGLLVVEAAIMAKEGKSAAEIAAKMEEIKPLNTPKPTPYKITSIVWLWINPNPIMDIAFTTAMANAVREISERCPNVDTPKQPVKPPKSATTAKDAFCVYSPANIARIIFAIIPSRTSKRMVISMVPIATGKRYPTCAARSVTVLKFNDKNKS